MYIYKTRRRIVTETESRVIRFGMRFGVVGVVRRFLSSVWSGVYFRGRPSFRLTVNPP